MTATAGLTVPHSNNPIFQYIFDCLGKRSIRSISKIVAFGAQKIQTSSLKSWCTHNEWLFGANLSKVALLGNFCSKMSNDFNEFLFPKIQRRLRPWNTKSKLPFLGLKPKQSKMYWKIGLIEWGTVRPAVAVILMMLCSFLNGKVQFF